MTFARIVLVLAALMFGLLGVWLTLAPGKLEEWVGIVAESPAAKTELRALYGGLEIGLAVFFLIAVLRTEMVATASFGLGLFMAGVGAARVWGFVVDGSGAPKLYAFLGSEILFAVLGFLAYAWTRGES